MLLDKILYYSLPNTRRTILSVLTYSTERIGDLQMSNLPFLLRRYSLSLYSKWQNSRSFGHICFSSPLHFLSLLSVDPTYSTRKFLLHRRLTTKLPIHLKVISFFYSFQSDLTSLTYPFTLSYFYISYKILDIWKIRH